MACELKLIFERDGAQMCLVNAWRLATASVDFPIWQVMDDIHRLHLHEIDAPLAAREQSDGTIMTYVPIINRAR